MAEQIIEYCAEKGIVSIRINGVLNQNRARAFLSQAVAEAALHECGKFLIDFRQASVAESTFGILNHVKELGEIGLRKSDLVAVIAVSDLSEHQFFETAARNRGWYNIQFFQTESDALKWLESE